MFLSYFHALRLAQENWCETVNPDETKHVDEKKTLDLFSGIMRLNIGSHLRHPAFPQAATFLSAHEVCRGQRLELSFCGDSFPPVISSAPSSFHLARNN